MIGVKVAQYSSDLIDQTVALWNTRTERPISREQARQMVENVSDFFAILAEWDAQECGAEQPTCPEPGEAL